MAAVAGQYTPAPLTPGNTEAKYGTHYSFFGIGGLHEYVTLEQRNEHLPVDETYGRLNEDGMSSGRRRLGMIVFVFNENRFYQLLVPNFFALATAEAKYLALADNGNWKENPFLAAPSVNILRVPLTYLYADHDTMAEVLFAQGDFDFRGRFIDSLFILDTSGMETAYDPNAHQNVMGEVGIIITDSLQGGLMGKGIIKKRVNGELVSLDPGDLKAGQTYFLVPPLDRARQGTHFIHPFELVKWGWNATAPATTSAGMFRIPAGQLYGSADSQSETLFAFGDFDFSGRYREEVYLLDAGGLGNNMDYNARANLTADVSIKIIDSTLGGTIGTAKINKRVNGELVHLDPGDLKQGQLYFLLPPADRSVNGINMFNNPFELVKWDWYITPPAPAPMANLLRIPASQLYGGADDLSEIFFAFGDFDFNGRYRDELYLFDTGYLNNNIDANAHTNLTGDVYIRVTDNTMGGLVGTAVLKKRVNGQLVSLAPGDLQQGQLYFLLPPADRFVDGSKVFANPFELVKWDWMDRTDKHYVIDFPIGDSMEVLITGETHGLQKIPSVTVIDINENNKVINDVVSIAIDPVTFDVRVVMTEWRDGKVVLN